jgi:hypothetical protein
VMDAAGDCWQPVSYEDGALKRALWNDAVDVANHANLAPGLGRADGRFPGRSSLSLSWNISELPTSPISLSFWVELVGACNLIWYQSQLRFATLPQPSRRRRFHRHPVPDSVAGRAAISSPAPRADRPPRADPIAGCGR